MAGFKSIDLAKAKTAAVALANEKIETLRNMPYDSLATEHGGIVPQGNIKDNEEIIRRGVRFNVYTTISYVDDPFDGNAMGTIAGKPRDLYPSDYKKVEVTVSKIGRNGFLSRLTSNISAKAAETPSNSGIIYFCVIDSNSQPVPEADVTIVNSDIPLTITVKTGIDGCIMVPNLPPDEHNHYHLTATKDGYSLDQTYTRTSQNPNELYADINVMSQQVTPKTLVIDLPSKMIIDVVDTSGAPVSNVALRIHHNKETYFNPTTYKYDQTLNTDANGHLELDNMEFGSYSISPTGWQVVVTSPFQLVGVPANVTKNIKLVLSNNSSYMRITNYDPISGNVGETAHITFNGSNFDSLSTVKLIKDSTEIVASNVTVTKNEVIECDLNLSGATAGSWDILVENSRGESARQIGGFEVK